MARDIGEWLEGLASSRHSGPTSAFAPIAFALPPGADSAAPGAAKATEGESRGGRLGLAGPGPVSAYGA